MTIMTHVTPHAKHVHDQLQRINDLTRWLLANGALVNRITCADDGATIELHRRPTRIPLNLRCPPHVIRRRVNGVLLSSERAISSSGIGIEWPALDVS